jgi:hypothetical protein
MSQQDQMLQAIEALTTAAEARIKAETERSEAERQRLEAERLRLRVEHENNALLCRILQDTSAIAARVGEYSANDHDRMLQMLESILALTQVTALRVSGSELDVLVKSIDSVKKGVGMQVTLGDKATIQNIVEGQQYNNSSNIDTVLVAAINAIKADDPAGAETALNSLPGDMLDVAIAALNGPLAAARMIARKVGDKWRVSRSQTGMLLS